SVLFADVTLNEWSRYFRETKEDMLEIKGIGEKKYEQYGEEFLEAIQAWRNENPDAKKRIQISSESPVAKPKRTKDDRPSHMISYQLFQSGKSIKEIAAMRDFSQQTIESHRSEEHTSELQSRFDLVCRLLLEKKKNKHDD